MSAALFVPDFPDGACDSCGGLLSRGGRCPACMTFAHDLRQLLHVVPAFSARLDSGAQVQSSCAPSCLPAWHQPLQGAVDGLRGAASVVDGPEMRSFLLQILAAVEEGISACPAGESCAWGGR